MLWRLRHSSLRSGKAGVAIGPEHGTVHWGRALSQFLLQRIEVPRAEDAVQDDAEAGVRHPHPCWHCSSDQGPILRIRRTLPGRDVAVNDGGPEPIRLDAR
jgi:hypothetical protein